MPQAPETSQQGDPKIGAKRSWMPYLQLIINCTKGNADAATIIGLKDGEIWVLEDPLALKISKEEALTISRIFRTCFDKGGVADFYKNGVVVAGVKYTVVKDTYNEIKDEQRGNAKTHGLDVYAKGPKGSGTFLSLQQTKQAILIAHAPSGKTAGVLNSGLGMVQEHLIKVAY